MQTRFPLLIIMALSFSTAQAESKKIRWGVPLEYTTQTDQVSNTDILPRPNSTASTPAQNPPSAPSEPAPSAEDVATTEARLNDEVRILWDEIERAEKQQQQANDIKVLPKIDPEKTFSRNPAKTNHAKTKTPTTSPSSNIKAEKERIDALLNSTKDKNGKIIALPKTPNPLDKTDKKDKNDKLNTSKKTPLPTIVNVPQQPTVQPKPVLTRKQVLEEEIAREKAALKSAQTQLSIARKRGNMAQIQKLNGMIRDRELNVQAISRELSR